MAMNLPVLILHATGTNRDAEAARACELAGAMPHIVHINQLRAGTHRFSNYAMLVLPGGFSYGDALGAGVRQALDLQVFFHEELTQFIATGKPVLGICNGFSDAGQGRPSARLRRRWREPFCNSAVSLAAGRYLDAQRAPSL